MRSFESNQRSRIEEYKQKLHDDDILGKIEFDYRADAKEPSTTAIKKLGRVALGMPVVRDVFRKQYEDSQTRQKQEAKYVALEEFDVEREEQHQESQRVYEERLLRARQEREEMDLQREQREREREGEELIVNMEIYRDRKKEQYQGERIQEISEKLFNDSLTKVELIDAMAEAGDAEVGKRTIENEGKMTTVYDMKGKPLSFMQHRIDFKGRGEADNSHRKSSTTAKMLQDNPALWSEKKALGEDYGGADGDAKGNTISMSYINTDKNFRAINQNGYMYGFDHIRPDTIIQISKGDAASSNNLGDGKTLLSKYSIYTPEELEKQGITSIYNEVQVRRFDWDGNPQLPDYMIVKDGKIPEVTLRHAAYFDIPIVNIETKYYREKEENRLLDAIDTVSFDSDYSRVKEVLDTINSSFMSRGSVEANVVGLWEGVDPPIREAPSRGFGGAELEKKLKEFAELELVKREQYIKTWLTEKTDGINSATERGEFYHVKPEDFQGVRMEEYDGIKTGGETMHTLRIEVGGVPITTVHDGANPSPEAPYPHSPGANSNMYNELLPYVAGYVESLDRNSSGGNPRVDG